ncbi:MAG: YfdX family protein [Hyphomicrobium sp.]|nr:YfdX family protein [Hyphomicrobium sp.]
MNKTLAAGIVASVLLALPIMAFAKEQAKDHVAAASQSDKDTQKLIKLSDEGFVGLRAVRAARLSIFNGNTVGAEAMIEEALKQFQQAKKEAKDYVTRLANMDSDDNKKELWIPIDASLALGEDFIMTDEKEARIAEANKHFKNNDAAKAVAALQVAEVDVRYTRILLPLNKAISRLSTANDQYENGKYYEANLTLKGIEDSVILDTVMLIDLPTASDSKKPEKVK